MLNICEKLADDDKTRDSTAAVVLVHRLSLALFTTYGADEGMLLQKKLTYYISPFFA